MRMGLCRALYQATEKVVVSVIPSEAMNPLFADSQEKADSSGKNRPRNDALVVFQQPATGTKAQTTATQKNRANCLAVGS
jgi:hypothetical protein